MVEALHSAAAPYIGAIGYPTRFPACPTPTVVVIAGLNRLESIVVARRAWHV
jgi:hypothetical protein